LIVKEVVIKRNGELKFNLMPFGDLQAGSAVFDKTMWSKYVEDIKSTPNVITIGMGDYTDHFRPTIQGRLKSALALDEAEKTLERWHGKDLRDEVVPLLKPVIENTTCLGLLGGHHDMTYSDGTNSTQRLCQELGVDYLGDGETMIRVKLVSNNGETLSFVIYATHGQGNGQAVGSNITKLERMSAFFDADILLRGHSCDKFIFQVPQYYLAKSIPPRFSSVTPIRLQLMQPTNLPAPGLMFTDVTLPLGSWFTHKVALRNLERYFFSFLVPTLRFMAVINSYPFSFVFN